MIEPRPEIDQSIDRDKLSRLLKRLRRSRYPSDPVDFCDSGDFIRVLNHAVLTSDIDCLDSPAWLNWDITTRCNLHCLHCAADAVWDPNGKGNDPVDTRQAHAIVDELARNEVLNVVLSGGEPFMRSDIYDILVHLKEAGIFVTILTNGSLPIDFDALARLLDPTTDLVQVSLDGPTAKIHNRQRGAAAFAPAVHCIQELVRREITMKVNMVLTSINFLYALDVYHLARRLDVPVLSFTVNCPVGRGEEIERYDQRQHLLLSLELLDWQECYETPAVRNNILLVPYAVPEVRELVPPDSTVYFPRYRCLAGIAKAVLDAWGNLYPCPFMLYPAFKAGNILERSFRDVWMEGMNWEDLRRGRDLRDTKCEACGYLNVCRGECPGPAYALYGTVHSPDPRCTFSTEGYS
ncbi:MAG: radical SAM protein [Anaerolineae bacterium]|nr:radical SAM protein [Anaerolineae bacterium]NIQ82546.1 radical SAM protein [Anaerolineae bacterium]